MLSARYSPLVSQAEITGKAQPDLWEFARRKAQSGDAQYMERAYAGDDFSIMPGELVIGHRKRVGHASFHARSQEAGFSSVAGMNYGDAGSVEGLMRSFYFLGVAKGEYQHGGDNLYGTDPMDHGFGFLRAGSMSINNNSPQDIYAGDPIAWRLPPVRGGDPRTQGSASSGRTLDTGLNPRVSYNRTGTPYGKPLVQIERFDPSDFSFQLAGAYALFDKPSAQGGVSDLGCAALFSDKSNLSSLQEEALGYKCGLLMSYARARDVTDRDGEAWARNSGILTDGELSAEARNILNALFLRNVTPGENTAAIGNLQADYTKLKVGEYKFYADHLFDMLCGAIAGGWHTKASRVIGKAMGNAKSTQTLDIMVSHFKCGY